MSDKRLYGAVESMISIMIPFYISCDAIGGITEISQAICHDVTPGSSFSLLSCSLLFPDF
jgi:hypothetical protein